MNADDYKNLIPPPNIIQPKLTEWVKGNAQVGVDVQDAINDFINTFNLYDAVGNQLDILGDLVGVARLVNFQPSGGLSGVMSDDIYRIAIIARIILNSWRGTKSEIYDFWQTFLPQYPIIIQDNQNMTMSVLVIGMPNDTTGAVLFSYDLNTATEKGYDQSWWEPVTGVLRSLVTNNYFIPKPSGVSLSISFMDDPAFCYDADTDLLKGYDEGYWPVIV